MLHCWDIVRRDPFTIYTAFSRNTDVFLLSESFLSIINASIIFWYRKRKLETRDSHESSIGFAAINSSYSNHFRLLYNYWRSLSLFLGFYIAFKVQKSCSCCQYRTGETFVSLMFVGYNFRHLVKVSSLLTDENFYRLLTFVIFKQKILQ